ncbi:histidinol-phosphatase [Clostridium acetireducens DSM 10703]|jgi:histidinol-phosphatase (PHP family)|uniref:Histidinol-phosphatase n=1 Tax=Clostridium acetireducens DSM 10703 TaxID=1121290 RepID=A0A1E8EX63_9CLOT|nr:histidinol phosphate phosphatase [Clostridium acetireducens]OFI05366.1 histidinol-phosphatase [Clostridium acetireducens DSM 10703]
MFDTHVHTNFSTDSEMTLEEVIRAKEKVNIGVILTEHLDLNFMKPGQFIFDIDKYFNDYSKFRKDNLLLGVEMGMRMDCIEKNEAISKKYPFDYIIGSIHVINNMDLYYKDFYVDKSKNESYSEYLKSMLQCIKNYDFVDSLGHIDYICRYARYEDTELYYEEYSDIIDEILKVIVEKEKCIEINTRRFEDKKIIDNAISIYKRFYELGGKFVTIGSDAHKPQSIGLNYKYAKYVADKCNLNIVYFKNRKMEYDK